ncbi:MAG: PEGA domain-containing protein, partial [Candidatus Micrarchaeota archaeon]
PSPVPAGSLQVSSTPVGALVYINGAFYADAPFTISSIAPGTYNLRFSLTGYNDEYRTATIVSGQVTAVSVTMTPLPPIISGLSPSGLISSQTYANVIWNTNVATVNNSIRYKETDLQAYGNYMACGLSSTTMHQCTISNLLAGVAYDLNVISCINSNPSSCSEATSSFTTAPASQGCSCSPTQCIYDRKPGPECVCNCAPAGDARCVSPDNDCS